MNAIEAIGLTRYYGNLCAVDHLNLTVRSGEIFGFLGPNGAGKTTTIRMLTGLVQATEGSARVAGYDVRSDALEVKRRIGMVPQRSNLYEELSARDNLIFMAKLYGLPRSRWRQRADELLEQFGLTERAWSPFATLSGGLKRRLTIAAALIHQPSIIFLDEPTSGLDVKSARGIRRMVTELRDAGVTVFLTTHLIAEAEQLADRVAIIDKGRLIAVDTPAGLCAACNSQTVLEVTLSPFSEGLIDFLRSTDVVEAVSRKGDTLRLGLTSLDAGLSEVITLAHRYGAAITEIRTLVPTLEDAFVQLTDLDVEDMQAEPGNGQRGIGV